MSIWATAKLHEIGVEFVPGGNELSLKQDVAVGMDKYVHLCWDLGHDMKYHVKNRGIKVTYLQIDRLILYEPGVLFTPGVANSNNMPTYSVQEAVDGGMIDYDAINRKIGSFYPPGQPAHHLPLPVAERPRGPKFWCQSLCQ